MNVKRTWMIALVAMASMALVAQQPSTDSAAAPAPVATNPQAPATAAPEKKETKEEKKARKEREKKEKQAKKDQESSVQDVQDTSVFTQREANDVLGQIRDGLEGHSQRLMLGAFDSDKMDGYLSFEDQIEAFFTHYEGIRVNIRIIQSSVEAGKGVVTASFQMEATPRNGNPLRREGQLRFELEHTKKGWRVVDVSPRSFFS
jgi:hypothetical protein